jgi:hypothetical protein
MDTYTILDILERRKSSRRAADNSPLSTYWPGLTAAALAILLLGIVIGRLT